MCHKKSRGFTLVELLVVIAVIGILIGMLMPAVQQVREAARRTSCMNNMRNIGLAMNIYEGAHGQYPSGWISSGPSTSGRSFDSIDPYSEPGWGWSVPLLPHLEAANVYERINLDLAIDDEVHHEIVESVIPVFLCPSDPNESIVNLNVHIEEHGHHDDDDHDDDDDDHDGSGFVRFLHDDDDHDHEEEFWVSRSNYSGVFGNIEIEGNETAGNGTFYANSTRKTKYFRDGLSNTIIVGERRNDFGTISWVGMVPEFDEPAARIVGSADHTPNHEDGHFEDFRSYHNGGIVTVLADGSTHFVTDIISPDVWHGLSTPAGGEIVSIKQ